ncbi:hypothetical protein Tco_0675360, partial [Tanacetum coccineum]
MASLDHRLNPLFSIKECMSCGALYTRNCGCSKGSLEDKILVPKPPQNCKTCGNPVNGLNCRSCAFVRKCLNEGWYTIRDENKIPNTSESSKDNTNVVSAPRESFVFNQNPGVNSSQSPLQINHNCCYKCGDSLDGIFCQRCTCKFCGNGAHIGYNCPPKAPITSNPEQCNQTINELPQTLPSVHPTCNSGDENSFTYDSKPNSVNESPNVFNPLPQPPMYSCEFCGNNARYDCGGPHETFQCQPMNEDYYKQNSCYDPNSFGFDQFQPPQFPVNYSTQETSREILQAQEDLMEAIQAFLKEYDHIPPNKKCMALLLAEERFLKINHVMEEEQNQPGVMQDLLLKLMDDLQILKGSQQEKKETAVHSCTPYWDVSMIDDERARENFLKDVCTFLRKFSRIPFGVTPKVILIAWERFGEIKDALMDKQYRQEDIQELMSKLLEDVRNISEELSEYINCPSWNRPTFYDNDDDEYTIIYSKPKAITPDLSIKDPDNSLNMGDDHLDTIPSIENLFPIPSEFERISEDTCEDPSTLDSLNNHSEILSDFNNDGTSSDDDSYENTEYVEASPLNLEYDSLEEVNEDQKEKEFDLEDIFQIQDIILREKLLNVHPLISNIESLKNNPTPDHVFKSPSSVPISVTDSGSFFEESDTFLSHLDSSLPEFKTFNDYTEETRSGSTTTHANNSLPEYDSFLFEIEPNQGGLTSVVISDNSNDPFLETPEFESFHFDLYDDLLFPRPLLEPPDNKNNLIVEIDAPVINNVGEINVED